MKVAVITLLSFCLYIAYVGVVCEKLIPIVYPLGRAIGLPIVLFVTVLPAVLIVGNFFNKDCK